MKDFVSDTVVAPKTAAEISGYLSRVFYNRRNKFNPLWNEVAVGGFQSNGESYAIIIQLDAIIFILHHTQILYLICKYLLIIYSSALLTTSSCFLFVFISVQYFLIFSGTSDM